MPIRGYFLYVGGVLVALLLAADLYVPQQDVREEAPHAYNIQITAAPSTNAPITFSGETRDFGAPPPMTVVDLASKAHDAPQAAHEQSMAQQPAQQASASAQQPKPVRKKIARRKVSPPAENSYAQIPDEWRHRYSYGGTPAYTGMAFARPPGW